MTILKTATAIIAGKKSTVETVTKNAKAQHIAYRVNGKYLTADTFWAMKPKFKG